MEFYSVILKKKIDIPNSKVVYKVVKGKNFAVGTYLVGGHEKQAWRIVGKAK
jgi:hypothetical protein